MRKLRLDLDALQVDTFQTLARGYGAGTILGNADTGMGQRTCASCPEITCVKPCESNDQNTCMGTCDTCASCPEISCVKACETNDQNTCMGTCNTCASCPEISCVKACPS